MPRSKTDKQPTRILEIWLEGGIVFIPPVLLYLLLGRGGFYEVDGQSLVHWLAVGEGNHDRHILFMPLARFLAAPLLALGLTPFQALRSISAMGMAMAVLFFWAAALRLDRSRTERLLLVAAIACSPAVLFFSSIVEFHGLFLSFAAIAWFCEACLERSKRPLLPAVALGCATGVAALVHGTGQLLGLLLPLYYLLRLREDHSPVRPSILLAIVAVVCHAVVVLGLGSWLREDATRGQEDFILSVLEVLPPLSELGSDFLHEWILAFLPVSLLCWAGLRSPAHRPQAFWLLGAVLFYVLLSWILVPGMHERGAYLLPLVFPAALFAVRMRPRWPLVFLTLLGVLYGIHDLRGHEMSSGSRLWAEALVQVEARQKGFYLLGNQAEIDALLIREPNIPYLLFGDSIVLLRTGTLTPAQVRAGLLALATAQGQNGRRLCLSESAWQLLSLEEPAVEAARQQIGRAFQRDPVERGEFRAWVLVPR